MLLFCGYAVTRRPFRSYSEQILNRYNDRRIKSFLIYLVQISDISSQSETFQSKVPCPLEGKPCFPKNSRLYGCIHFPISGCHGCRTEQDKRSFVFFRFRRLNTRRGHGQPGSLWKGRKRPAFGFFHGSCQQTRINGYAHSRTKTSTTRSPRIDMCSVVSRRGLVCVRPCTRTQ